MPRASFGADVVCDVRARHKFPLVSAFIATNGEQSVVVSGDLTGERVRSALHRAYTVESSVEGIGRYGALDAVAWP